MKISPLVTLAAVAAFGVGLFLINVSKEPEPAKPGEYGAASTTVATPPPAPPPPPAPQFPAKADYVGKIPDAVGTLTLEITVDATKAIAYACDGNKIEAWLKGSATNGLVSLVGKDPANRLEGRLEGTNVVGTLWIGQKQWSFTAASAQPPAGLYVYDQDGVRTSWIIDQNNGVTGVQRQSDGSTTPAPGLSTDGTAAINGRPVVATRVEGDSNVI
jgi:hypothetical protein